MKARILDAEDKKQIVDLYHKEVAIEGIANLIGVSPDKIRKYIREQIAEGKLTERPRIKRARHVAKEPKESKASKLRSIPREDDNKEVIGDNWVRCTKKIATHCVYGCSDYSSKINYCNYILITGHSRGCPWQQCTKFEKTSRNKPRLYKK